MNESARRRLFAAAAAVTVILGCASGSRPIDADTVSAKIAASEVRFRELAETTIADADRARTFLELLDERGALITRQAETVRSYIETMKALNADYDAARADFEDAILAYNDQRRLVQVRFADYTSRMKATTTEAEWRKLSRFEAKELDPRGLVYTSPGVQ